MSPKASHPPRSVHLFWGEDAFLLREAALELLGEGAVTEVDAGAWRGGELADLATPSLFGERRALVITDVRSLPDEGMRELAAYLAAPDPDAPLVLLVTVAERGKLPAALQRLAEPVASIREVKVARKDLPGWVVQRARPRGVDLAPDGASALVGVLGEDPAALDSAVLQLAGAFPGVRVTREVVASQFRGLGEQHVWDLCDRAFGRDLPGAERSLRSLLEGGDAGIAILGGIASRLRDLLRVKSLDVGRMPAADLARAAGLRFDWQAERYRRQASAFTLEELVALHAAVVDADRALKTGAPDDVVLPVLVAGIAGGTAA
ncbi:MAG: DNA polymerase III subunit delta [Actinomycetota bacterium]